MVTQGDPAEAFARIQARHARCVWLDGGGARDWSRRKSLIGWLEDDDVSLSYSAAAREVTRHQGGRSEVVGDDPFVVLEQELAAGTPSDQWFGYFGYAARPDMPALPDPDLPDAVWLRPSHIREYDHVPDGQFLRLSGVATPDRRRNPRAPGDSDTTAPTVYATAFTTVQEHLHAGNSYEVNLTYRTRTPSTLSPAGAYLRLRTLNPAPYAGYLQHDVAGAEAWLLSSSPERYALVTADRTLETKPIKGTTARGSTPDEDAAARDHLASDPKFRSENLMIVDLLRNDLAMVCDVGTVEVPTLMEVESYSSVHQLVSTVRGHLRDDVTTVGALRALFPAGSMTGAPKLRTMEIIEEVEATPRGAYSGAFGWISGDGRADLGVIIRTLVTAGEDYVLGTGGGITVASEVDDEYDETRWKAERLLQAILP
ncbi:MULTISPECIES: anthranilate synthase component I family protein [unclassified Nocardioides]|uniref:anthranilate synthase component I family protein n=1 Tax=unclassified Nocardioides TaxID=2615069 RepID=UPI0006F886F3|nr:MULTISPECIES: anthranilate synthase component I family protein [unclassified Nocardioides]KRA27845.1 anthranilate synthase [Nocardioides sp. Root614]KRA86692.1 anthranilate synthase [Nocardioides sp. Root682]